jgi:hypothetical protein
MQRGVALGTIALPVYILWQSCSAVKTARSDYMLNQAWKAGPSNVERGAGSIRFGTVLAPVAVGRPIAIGIHVAPLLVLSVVVHYLYSIEPVRYTAR